jgi:tripartite-type tricarboxylate transporter receptor subunit TctC
MIGPGRGRTSHRSMVAILPVTLLLTLPALAQDYPSRPVTIIVPYPAGGLGDILPRAMADVLQRQTGQPFVIDNKPGATQMLGTRLAARATPDGYTLLFGSVTSLAINPAMKSDLPYDPVKDFEPIALTYVSPMYLVTRLDLPVNAVKDLIALAKREPGKLNYASGGVGSSSHLAGELFKTLAGVSMTHVPYAGTGPAVRDVIGGFVDLTFTGSGMSYARNGQVKALAVTSAARSEAAAEIPTLAELGLPGYEATIWFGFLAPAGTPGKIVDALYAEMKRAVDSGALADKLRANSDEVELVARPPAEFRALIGQEMPRWRGLFRPPGSARTRTDSGEWELTLSKGQPIERAAAMLLRTAVMQEIAAKREGWAGPNRLARQTARRVPLLMVYSVNL